MVDFVYKGIHSVQLLRDFSRKDVLVVALCQAHSSHVPSLSLGQVPPSNFISSSYESKLILKAIMVRSMKYDRNIQNS